MLYAGTCSCQYEWPGTGNTLTVYNAALSLPSTVTIGPPVEPLTLDEVKLDRRVDHDLDDELLTVLIQASREYCERYTGSSLVTQTREVIVPAYVDGMALPFGPVQTVTVSEDGPPYTVTYVAGYPPTDDDPPDYAANVPASFKVAMKLLIGNWYENREATVTGTINTTLELAVRQLLDFFRRRLGVA
jgi:gp6-like head-tail connector protein